MILAVRRFFFHFLVCVSNGHTRKFGEDTVMRAVDGATGAADGADCVDAVRALFAQGKPGNLRVLDDVMREPARDTFVCGFGSVSVAVCRTGAAPHVAEERMVIVYSLMDPFRLNALLCASVLHGRSPVGSMTRCALGVTSVLADLVMEGGVGSGEAPSLTLGPDDLLTGLVALRDCAAARLAVGDDNVRYFLVVPYTNVGPRGFDYNWGELLDSAVNALVAMDKVGFTHMDFSFTNVGRDCIVDLDLGVCAGYEHERSRIFHSSITMHARMSNETICFYATFNPVDQAVAVLWADPVGYTEAVRMAVHISLWDAAFFAASISMHMGGGDGVPLSGTVDLVLVFRAVFHVDRVQDAHARYLADATRERSGGGHSRQPPPFADMHSLLKVLFTVQGPGAKMAVAHFVRPDALSRLQQASRCKWQASALPPEWFAAVDCGSP